MTSSGGGSGRSGSASAPAVIVLSGSSPQVSRPIIVVNRRGYRTQFSLFGFLLTIAICYGAYYYSMRLRNNIASSVNAAEHSAERANEHGGGEHKKK